MTDANARASGGPVKIAIAAALLLAIGLVAFLALGGGGDAPRYQVVASAGAAGQGSALDAVYQPDSPVRILLRPEAGDAPRAAVRAWIKRGEISRPIGEPLRPVGRAAWALEVPAKALFERPGRYSLHFGLAADEAAIDGVRQDQPGVQWLSLEVEYRRRSTR